MMLSRADFDELFSSDDEPDGPNSCGANRSSIARWEDDGGLTRHPLPIRRAEHRLSSRVSDNSRDSMRVGVAISMMPATAVLGATSAMMTAFDKLMRP